MCGIKGLAHRVLHPIGRGTKSGAASNRAPKRHLEDTRLEKYRALDACTDSLVPTLTARPVGNLSARLIAFARFARLSSRCPAIPDCPVSRYGLARFVVLPGMPDCPVKRQMLGSYSARLPGKVGGGRLGARFSRLPGFLVNHLPRCRDWRADVLGGLDRLFRWAG